ncbi:MAG TPA: YicC/YloC family endoribonuclease [Alphaproteobacteria bacterium]|nr:YicC/YloC family endoribonuclease [Alphaproteobacteria bacterium]
MAVVSMTGFARAEGADEGISWRWEIKSVNGRGLDLRIRLAPGLDRLEPMVRERVAARFSRGSFNVGLATASVASGRRYAVNRQALDSVLELVAELTRGAKLAPPQADGVLRVPGVLEAAEAEETEEERQRRDRQILASLDQALVALGETRAAEGARLAPMLAGHLDRIAELAKEARALAATQPAALKEKLERQIAEIAGAAGVTPDRIAQEVALLVSRGDVREELDRLTAHVAQGRELLAGKEAVGRRLDFLSQELNREANTLCSKSSDLALTRIGLELKAAIEQFREQIQNIE